MWRLLLASLLAFGARAFAGFSPAPLKWGGLPSGKIVLATRDLPNSVMVSNTAISLPQKLTLRDLDRRTSLKEIPFFTRKADKTIAWDAMGWCVEAGGEQSGDAIFINRCIGGPSQQWNILPCDHGRRSLLQLERTNKCIDVVAAGKAFNGASVELRECEETSTAEWNFDPSIPLPTQGHSHHITQFSAWHAMVSLASVAAVAALSLGAELWRRQKRQLKSALDADQGGVSLSGPLAMKHGSTPLTSSSDASDANMQRTIPAVLALSPTPVEDDHMKRAAADEAHPVVFDRVHTSHSSSASSSSSPSYNCRLRAASVNMNGADEPSTELPSTPLPLALDPSTADMTRRQILATSFLAAGLLLPKPAEAALGSSRAAATSQPYVGQGLIDNLSSLDPRKQAQVEGVLNPYQIKKLLKQLSSIEQKLEDEIDQAMKTTAEREKDVEELKRKRLEAEKALSRAQIENENRTKQLSEVEKEFERKNKAALVDQNKAVSDARKVQADVRAFQQKQKEMEQNKTVDSKAQERLEAQQQKVQKAKERVLENYMKVQADKTEVVQRMTQQRTELESQKQKVRDALKDSQDELDRIEEQLRRAEASLKLAAEVQGEALKKAQAELAKEQERRKRIAKRAETLAALEAQPEWFNYVAAFAASCVSTLVMHPLDTIKTRAIAKKGCNTEEEAPSVVNAAMYLDAVDGKPAVDANGDGSSKPAEAGTDNGALDSKVGIESKGVTDDCEPCKSLEETEEEAWTVAWYLSLYQGLPGALLKEGPPSALYLGVYEAVKTKLLASPELGQMPIICYLIAGALGETVGSVVRAPAETIKSRMQSGMDSSTGESVQRVLLDSEGRSNVFRSWSASLWRDVPFGAIQLAIFEGLKSYIVSSQSGFLDIDVNALTTEVVLGATGGAIGALLTVPLDVLTLRIMTQSPEGEQLDIVSMAKKVYEEEGIEGFVTGWKERLGYWAPAISIFLTCYCSIRQEASQIPGLFGGL